MRSSGYDNNEILSKPSSAAPANVTNDSVVTDRSKKSISATVAETQKIPTTTKTTLNKNSNVNHNDHHDSNSNVNFSSSFCSSLSLLLPSPRGILLVFGIYICFLAFGFFQESIFRFGDKQLNDMFRYPVFLVLVLCLGNIIVSAAVLFVESKTSFSSHVDPPEVDDSGVVHQLSSPTVENKRRRESSASFLQHYLLHVHVHALWQIALTSITYVGSMVATNYALSHVNYPTTVLVKSAKCVPVILGGLLIFKKKYPFHDYFAVFVITVALIVFNLMSPGKSSSSTTTTHQTILGWVALGVSLFCDSLTGPRQDHLLSLMRISSTHLMFITNIFGTFFACLALIVFEGFDPLNFCLRYPEVNIQILMFCISAGLGQLFIFASLTAFGSLYLVLITTTRKFFTVLLSIVAFGHSLTFIQASCVTAIFTSLMAQSYLTKKMKLRAISASKEIKKNQ